MAKTVSPTAGESGAVAALVDLDDRAATDRALVGGKAAALARAAGAGIPTLPGVVLTTAFCTEVDGGTAVDGHPAVRRVLDHFGSGTSLVARSSSVVEDASDSSEAGQFESVVGIAGLAELEAAVETVLASRADAGATDHPIAVLVQPLVEPTVGGVLFGVDPVTGRSDRRVVTAVAGQPDRLVSGEVDGSRYELEPDGTVVDAAPRDGATLGDDLLHALTELSDRVSEVFGGAQDVEWAVVGGDLVLLQSRPVTTEVRGVPGGPVYGPGPVAETFPERLTTLEQDLWIPPLREAVAEALRLAGAVPPADLAGAPLVRVVDGYAAIDLERTGEIDGGRASERGLGVLRRIRRLRSAWRIGRLRSALPALGERLVRRVDADLESLPPFSAVTDRQLVALLARSREALRSLHANEMLAGLLGDGGRGRLTGASVAMRVLTEARTDGRSDAEIIARSPVVLALTPPKVTGTTSLPDGSRTPDLTPSPARPHQETVPMPDPAVVREALRLRVRWLQELSGRAAWELGCRLHRVGRLEDAEDVRWLGLDDLIAIVTKRAEVVPAVLRDVAAHPPEGSPLPARFRVSDRGRPVPELPDGDAGGGTGAGGGRGTGPVTYDADDPPAGSVLVVTTLHPGIGPVLPRLAGLVAETGSVLAHLAILAREADVATVVGYHGATERLDEGDTVTVDGHTGQVFVGAASDTGSGEEPS